MDAEQLQEGYRRILEHIYAPKNYYQRLRTFLTEYRQKADRQRIDFNRIFAFVRSIWRLGILGRERVHFWKLLLWTQRNRPELLPLAVTLAIYGHHFRRVCQLSAT
jgi:hypothetical protein